MSEFKPGTIRVRVQRRELAGIFAAALVPSVQPRKRLFPGLSYLGRLSPLEVRGGVD